MRTIIGNFLHKFKENTFWRIFIFMSIPFLVFSVVFAFNNTYYFNHYKFVFINNYANELNTFLRNTEKDIDTITKNAKFLTFDTSFCQSFTAEEKPTAADLEDTTATIASLKNFVSSSPIIDSAALVNRSGQFVLTNTGLYDLSDYFNSVYHYGDYSADYWKNYREVLLSTQLLPPTTVDMSNIAASKNVIPIVFVSLGDLKSSNLLIVNIDIALVFEELSTYRFTPNTSVYMLNKYTLRYFSADDTTPFPLSNDTALMNRITTQQNEIIENLRIHGKKHILCSASSNNSVWGYSHIITIPYSDINRNTNNIYLALILIAVLLIILIPFLTYYESKKIYHPIERLATLLGVNHNSANHARVDIMNSIQDSILNMMDSNEELKHDLSISLPLSQEKYLIDIINGNDAGGSDAMQKFEKIAFRHPYYISVVVHLILSKLFFETANHVSPQVMQNEIYKVIQSVFSQRFDTFVLPSAGNVLYLLLNVGDDDCMDEINRLIETAENLFVADRDYLDLTFVTGNIASGIEGLKRTHNEAIINLSKITNAKQLQTFPESRDEYSFNINSENILINYLIAGYSDKAKEFLNEILEKAPTLSPIARNQLYTDIANVLFKVMHIKKIPYFTASSGSNAEIILNLLSKTNDNIHRYFIDAIDKIAENMEVSNTKIQISEVIDYINTHFTEDLYLEILAQQYNTTPKYLSKRIKQHLNVSFKDYLANLRIDYAKELLKTTDIKIADLAEKAGFCNRSTLVRTFKLKAGLTPSEYKSLYNKKGK